MLASISVGFVPPSPLSLGDLFSLVTMPWPHYYFLYYSSSHDWYAFAPSLLCFRRNASSLEPFLLLELATMVVSFSALMLVVLLVGVAATSFHHVLTTASKTILPTSVGSNSQASYCPSYSDSSSSLFPSTAQYPCSLISCDLDVGRVSYPLPSYEY